MMNSKLMVPLLAAMSVGLFVAGPAIAGPAEQAQEAPIPVFAPLLSVQEVPLVRGRATNFWFSASGRGVLALKVTLMPLPKGLVFVGYGSTPYKMDPVTKRPTWTLQNLTKPSVQREFKFRIKPVLASPLYTKARQACVRLSMNIVRPAVDQPPSIMRTCLRVVAAK